METTLKNQTTFALEWSFIGTIINVFLQIGFTASLGRLISPSEYGILTMANVFITFGSYFSQMGLGPALIQKKELTNEDIRASFTLATLLGLSLGLLAFFLAPLVGLYFRNERVISVFRWISLSYLLTGLSLTPISLLRRQLNFKVITLLETGAFAVGNGLVAIPCAVSGLGVWSLVWGFLTQQLLIALGGFFFFRTGWTPIFSKASFRKSLRFGAHYSINSLLDFWYANLEVILIGRFFTEKMVGLFNRSQMLVSIPMERSVASISRVMFPVFSKLQDQKEKRTEAFVTVFMLAGLVCSAISGGMIPAANEIIRGVLGHQWVGAIFAFQFLAVAIPLDYLMSLQGMFLDSMGKLGFRSQIRLLGLGGKLLLLLIGLRFGFTGFLTSLLAAQVIQQIIYLPFIQNCLGIKTWKLLFLYFVLIGNGALAGGIIWSGTFLCRCVKFPLLPILFIQIALGGFYLLFVFSLIARRSWFGIRKDTLASLPFLRYLQRKK